MNMKVKGVRIAKTEDGTRLLLSVVLLAIAGIILAIIVVLTKGDSGGEKC